MPKRYNHKRNYKHIQEHVKDIDFRTKHQRQLNWREDFAMWREDFAMWLDDLVRHRGTLASAVQVPLLYEIIEYMERVPFDAEGFVNMKKGLADPFTPEGAAVILLCNSVLWYIT